MAPRAMYRRRSYSYVYNSVYDRLRSKQALNSWVLDGLDLRMLRDVASRYYFSKHVLTIGATQRLGKSLHEATLRRAARVHRLSTLGRTMLLRRLQCRIIRYLWRPKGRLFHIHTPACFVH